MNYLTLPTDSAERKRVPVFRGVVRYFAAALAGVARISLTGNEKHNPGEEMHHARGKSTDHADCIVRHLMDVEDMLAAVGRAHQKPGPFTPEQILYEARQMAWRSLAYLQELEERYGAPLAPGAKLPPVLERTLLPNKESASTEDVIYATESRVSKLAENTAKLSTFRKADWMCQQGSCCRAKNHSGDCLPMSTTA